ncbi:transposase [Listeria seeligeri]|uniref:transposase n=1 Tax=Listeria seeligeri TaxID=1640 RepID=UPI0018892340|nr:transposase [Listeria seeligeri]MBF2643073.1 transposase [Listeria seeligeri]QPJ28037.1 transposase [Listeria seeligeri]
MKRNYFKEFKFQAVSLIIKEKHLVHFVSKQLEVHENTLYLWISEYEKHGNRAFLGNGSREFAAQKEVKRFEKENKKLKEALEVLKKFQVFLKRNHR